MGTVIDDILPLTGKLSITCVKANDISKKQLMGKQDPYCILDFGGQKKKTKVKKDGDRNPEWNETLEFDLKDCDDRDIQIKVMNEMFGPLDAECAVVKVPIYSLLGGETETWIPLYKKSSHEDECGKILFKTTFEGAGGLPPAPTSSRYGIVSAVYGTAKVRTDVRGLLERKVAGGALRFESKRDLSSFFGFDPLNNHIIGKVLNLTYMKAGQVKAVTVPERHEDTVVELEEKSLGSVSKPAPAPALVDTDVKAEVVAEPAAVVQKTTETIEEVIVEEKADVKKLDEEEEQEDEENKQGGRRSGGRGLGKADRRNKTDEDSTDEESSESENEDNERKERKFFLLAKKKDKYDGVCKLDGEKGDKEEVHIMSKTHKNLKYMKAEVQADGGFGKGATWVVEYLGNSKVRFLHSNREKYLKVHTNQDDAVNAKGAGGKACHFKVQNKKKKLGRLVTFESVASPDKFLRVEEDGSLTLGSDKGAASKFRVLRKKDN